MAEETVMLSNTIKICQILQGIQVGGAHMAKLLKLAFSDSPMFLARCYELQQIGIEVIIVEEEKWNREGRPNAVQLNEGKNLKNLIQSSDSPRQADECCAIR